jgi:2-polyprenyl-3-methyl-5-hydroxy-6-metoxy-1,4-benzoquinol methylase
MVDLTLDSPTTAPAAEKVNKNSKLKTWRNKDNNAFYDEIQVAGLQNYAKVAGLETGCDVAALKPYWEHAQSILEVGAGYGRVIKALREQGYQGDITAIERNKYLYDYTQQHYADTATILQQDIMDLDPNTLPKFDVILILWTGFSEFSPEEQPITMKKLINMTNSNGLLVIDLLPKNILPLKTKHIREKYVYILEAKKNINITIYIKDHLELKRYISNSKFKSIKTIKLTTSTQRKRLLHIID